MAFLPELPERATLLHVFGAFPHAATPLLEYHEAVLRGPSPLSVGDRELIAAYVSALNACDYCVGVHAATAEAFGLPAATIAALTEDVANAPVDERLKPILVYVRKLTRTPARMTESDAAAVFAAGWDAKALHDAVAICGLFNLMNRLVMGLGLAADQSYFDAAAKRLASAEGYRAIVALLKL
jgi:uncharacterized peroxidase-related enzyme